MSLQSSGLKGSVTMKLSQLQDLCKRDPLGYEDDYQQQFTRFNAELDILVLNPARDAPKFIELLNFVAAVTSSAYKQDARQAAASITALLKKHGGRMHQDTRRSCAGALILMRNRKAVDPEQVRRRGGKEGGGMGSDDTVHTNTHVGTQHVRART